MFIAFAVQTMTGRLSDHLRKHYKNVCAESLSSTDSFYDIPDETSYQEPMKTQMLWLLEDRLPKLSSRETQYLNLILFDDLNTRQIAESIQISEHTVHYLKKRLRIKLRPLKDELMK